MVMQFGSLCFMLTGAFVVVLTTEELSSVKYVLILRVLYGLGRGVFEGACRATYAELFAGDHLSTAFSAQTLLAGFSGGVCFFCYNNLSGFTIGMITVANGATALLTYGIMISHKQFLEVIPWSNLCELSTNRHYHRQNHDELVPLLRP